MFENIPNYFNVKLSDLLPWLHQVNDFGSNSWTWAKNWNCKYVNIRIDTRNGGSCYITDDEGNHIGIDDLMRQGTKENKDV